MRALNGLLLLAIALSVLPSSAGALELGPCEPAEAVMKIIDTSLGQRKTLQQAMHMMIKAKVLDIDPRRADVPPFVGPGLMRVGGCGHAAAA